MRSNEIARIAGVSVRTLRHYHQIGLLAEPPRQANGYRTYGTQHLIRLLRIGQLTALGMGLSEVAKSLDVEGGVDATALDELDRSLARQIETLEQQRKTVAALREGNTPLDLPPELTASLMALEKGRATAATKAGREQAVLFGQLVDATGRQALSALYAELAGPELSGIALQLGQRFDALGPHSSDKDIADLVDAYLHQLGGWLKQFGEIVRISGKDNADALLWTHAVERSNPQQRRMMAQLSARLEKLN